MFHFEINFVVVIRRKLGSAISKHYPRLLSNDFEFVKVRGRVVSGKFGLGDDVAFNYSTLKLLMGTGKTLYLRVLHNKMFKVLESDDSSSEDGMGLIVIIWSLGYIFCLKFRGPST